MLSASAKTVARLSLYRRILTDCAARGVRSIYSHELAQALQITATQVRRDLMVVGFSGSPNKGYDVEALLGSIRTMLDRAGGEQVALVGVGNLGRAILSYFQGRYANLNVAAAFDQDPALHGRLIHGLTIQPMAKLGEMVAANGIRTAILTVPAGEAQRVAEELIRVGIRGILNFAPLTLRVPEHIYIRTVDIAMKLETVAFFARQDAAREVYEA